MLSLKPEVRFHDARQALALIALVVERAFADRGFTTVVTSAGDGQHKEGSLHYTGCALDFRTKHVGDSAQKHAIVARIKTALPQCDVLFENEGAPNEHLHVEYDPK